MSQARRQSRGFHSIRAASSVWRGETRRGHTGPGAPVRGRLQSCAVGAPAFGLAGALGRVYSAVSAAKTVGRPAPGCCDRSGGGAVHLTGLRPHLAPGGSLCIGIGACS